MGTISSHRFTLFLILGFCGLSFAGAANAEARKISLRTICLAHANDLRELVLVTGKPEDPTYTTVELYTSGYSTAVEVTLQSGELVFLKSGTEQNTADSEDEQAKPQIIAKTKALQASRQLAVFVPSGKKDRPYNIKMIDESTSGFPQGSSLLFNFAPDTARFTIGEHGKELKPGKHGIVPQPKKVNRLKQCTFRLYYKSKGKWNIVSSTGWRIHEDLRNLAFAYIHPQTKRPVVSLFQEVPPWKK